MTTPDDLSVELAEKGARFTPIELALPEQMTLEEWAAIGRKLCRTGQVMQWWLGDWAAFGLRKYGRLKEFAEANNLNYGALRNLAYVSSNIELSRRRDNVEWSKHMEVASLSPKEQSKWLLKAESEGLTRAELRSQIRLSLGNKNALIADDGPRIKFVSKLLDDLLFWLNSQQEAFWTTDRKAIWRVRLKPLVAFYERLA
jgi:hypothetical protein